jgi:hypothetical protein
MPFNSYPLTGRLLIAWVATSITVIALLAGFVAAVDPFGYFGTNKAGYYYSSERQFKHTLVRGASYNAIILGDSRIAYTDPSYINLPQYKFVNGGMGGGSFSEQVALLLNSKLDNLDLVVMGLLYSSLAENCPPDPTAQASPWDAIRFSAAWTQVWFALETLRLKARGVEPYYRPDGTRVATRQRAADATLTDKNANYWRVIRHDSQYLDAAVKQRPGLTFTQTCLALVQRIQSLARKHGFRLVLVFLPVNRDLLDLADWKTFLRSEHSRRSFERLRAIVPDVIDFIDSSYSDSDNYWRGDAMHFRPEVGARMIEEAIRMTVGRESTARM